MRKLFFLLVVVMVGGGFFTTVVMAEEKSFFIQNKTVLQDGLVLMEEIKKVCPSQTDDYEEFAICTNLRILLDETTKRLLENMDNEEVFIRLHVLIQEIEEILSSDCCLIERTLNLFPSDPDKDPQRWTKGF